MRVVFADAGYWIALLNPSDSLHEKASTVGNDLGEAKIVTSEMVLVELLDNMARRGQYIRRAAADFVDRLRLDPVVDIVEMTSRQFEQAVKLYRSRLDQRWSLTDCASFQLMEDRNIQEALAHDRDYEHARFVALLRQRDI